MLSPELRDKYREKVKIKLQEVCGWLPLWEGGAAVVSASGTEPESLRRGPRRLLQSVLRVLLEFACPSQAKFAPLLVLCTACTLACPVLGYDTHMQF